METFRREDTEIKYKIFKNDKTNNSKYPVLLVHGFASNHSTNWLYTGWVNALLNAEYKIIAPDMRGHGQSTKHYETNKYNMIEAVKDCIELMLHLGHQKWHMISYSMGARITIHACYLYPNNIISAVLGGFGLKMTGGQNPHTQDIINGLAASNISAVNTEIGRNFRKFATLQKNDLEALLACIKNSSGEITSLIMSSIKTPILIANGEKDSLAQNPLELAKNFPNAKVSTIPNRDHMTVVSDSRLIQASIDFIKKINV